MPRRRLGVALLVPEPARTEVHGLRRALGEESLDRVPPHITLGGPVNVRDDDVDGALAALGKAAAATTSIPLTIGPASTFSAESDVVYLAVRGDGLRDVRRLRDAVRRVDVLRREDPWPFVAHVTLAVGVERARIDAAVIALSDYRVEVVIDRLHLLEEEPGHIWHPVADVPFGRGGQV